MPSLQNFTWIQYQDGTLTMQLEPPASIVGRSLSWTLYKRFGGVIPLQKKYLASGFNGSSGITIANGPQGIINIHISSLDTSGLQPGNYAGTVQFTDTGSKVPAALCNFLLSPNNLNP